jgi:hypothetical protein
MPPGAAQEVFQAINIHNIAGLVLCEPPSGTVPLTAGILEVISTVELIVTAVYAVTDGVGRAPSIDAKQIGAEKALTVE